MTTRTLALLLLCGCTSAYAVDFGVMESADPVRKGDFKFEAYPLSTRRTATREEDSGVNAAVGYGFWEDADLELQFATYDDVYFAGTDLEYSLVREPRHEFSVDIGAHYANTDFGTQLGADFTPLYSYKPASLPGFKWNAALDFAYDKASFAHANTHGLPAQYWSAYVVPGAQYRVARDVDVIGEVGLGLNADSNSYASVGLSFYFR